MDEQQQENQGVKLTAVLVSCVHVGGEAGRMESLEPFLVPLFCPLTPAGGKAAVERVCRG